MSYGFFSAKPDRKLGQAKPSHIMIQMADPEHAAELETMVNTNVPDLDMFKKFSLNRNETVISITLQDVEETRFSAAFLLALSLTLNQLLEKHRVEPTHLAFQISGFESANVALCLASSGLWSANYFFSHESDCMLFKEAHEEMKHIVNDAAPKVREEIQKKHKKS